MGFHFYPTYISSMNTRRLNGPSLPCLAPPLYASWSVNVANVTRSLSVVICTCECQCDAISNRWCLGHRNLETTHVRSVSLNQLTNRLHASHIHHTQSMHIHRKVAYYDTYHANPAQCATQSMSSFCSCFAFLLMLCVALSLLSRAFKRDQHSIKALPDSSIKALSRRLWFYY